MSCLLPRRRALAGALSALLAAAALTVAPPARADLFGGDLALLGGILYSNVQMAGNIVSMIYQIQSEVELMQRMVQTADPNSARSVLQFIQSAQYSYNSLTYGVQSMSYRLKQVDRDYQKLFPPDKPPPGTTTVAARRQQYQAWHQEVVAAGQIASRQQTTLSTLDDNAAQTSQVLAQSGSANSIVGQLQLVVQMIGITNSELLMLNQSLATTGRALTDLAAATASERLQSEASKDDGMAGYTDKGAAVAVPHTLPDAAR